MLMTPDGDHGRASAARSCARRTAGEATEKGQNLGVVLGQGVGPCDRACPVQEERDRIALEWIRP
jgi:hypothetical protein